MIPHLQSIWIEICYDGAPKNLQNLNIMLTILKIIRLLFSRLYMLTSKEDTFIDSSVNINNDVNFSCTVLEFFPDLNKYIFKCFPIEAVELMDRDKESIVSSVAEINTTFSEIIALHSNFTSEHVLNNKVIDKMKVCLRVVRKRKIKME